MWTNLTSSCLKSPLSIYQVYTVQYCWPVSFLWSRLLQRQFIYLIVTVTVKLKEYMVWCIPPYSVSRVCSIMYLGGWSEDTPLPDMYGIWIFTFTDYISERKVEGGGKFWNIHDICILLPEETKLMADLRRIYADFEILSKHIFSLRKEVQGSRQAAFSISYVP